MPSSPMITQIGLSDQPNDPYIKAKILHITANKMVFGEWIGPDGVFEDIIINPQSNEKHVIEALQEEMVVNIQQPKVNTKPGVDTRWRCFIRRLTEQPVWLQEAATNLEKQKTLFIEKNNEPAPRFVSDVVKDIENVSTKRALRVTINHPHAQRFLMLWCSQMGYQGNDAFSKAATDIICAAYRADLKCDE